MSNLQLVSVIAVIKVKNTYLLVKRNASDDIFPGKWQNLGGKIESGERVEQTLIITIPEYPPISLSPELEAYKFVTYDEAKELDTISPTSPTGTLSQITLAEKIEIIKT
jgi:hypothetical protein